MKNIKQIISIFLILVLSLPLIARENKTKPLKAIINSDSVIVRAFPDLKSEKTDELDKGEEIYIFGISDKKETIDNKTGYWIRIAKQDKYNNIYFNDNWIFSPFVKCDIDLENITVSKITPINLFRKNDKRADLDIKIERADSAEIYTVMATKRKEQDFYTFSWSPEEYDFRYPDPVGLFAYYPDTNTIKHISYKGENYESGIAFVSNDFKYLFEESGISPAHREITITDLTNYKTIYDGLYVKDSIDSDNSILIKEYYHKKTAFSDFLLDKISEETLNLGDEYVKNHSNVDYRTNTVVVTYKLNLNTMDKTVISCNLEIIP